MKFFSHSLPPNSNILFLLNLQQVEWNKDRVFCVKEENLFLGKDDSRET